MLNIKSFETSSVCVCVCVASSGYLAAAKKPSDIIISIPLMLVLETRRIFINII